MECPRQKTKNDWMNKKIKPTHMLSTETHFRSENIHSLNMREWKKISHANRNKKKAEVAILTSDKIDFKINSVTRANDIT